jgi:hypothetical protein
VDIAQVWPIEDIQAQDVDIEFLFNLEYRYAVLSRGMRH